MAEAFLEQKVFFKTDNQAIVTSQQSETWKRYLPGGSFWQNASPAVAAEIGVLLAFSVFFLFYGLVPIFGGSVLGLVGADEPRYAQIAREMLARHDYITPILYGKPWLEKPALYYWRAMFAFKEFGVHDWTARLPSASFALCSDPADLSAHAPLSSRRPAGCRAHYGVLRGHHRLCARSFYGHAAGRAFLHRHAGLVCVV